MKIINLFFYYKVSNIKINISKKFILNRQQTQLTHFNKSFLLSKSFLIKNFYFNKLINLLKPLKTQKVFQRLNLFFFINRFILNFIEFFFKNNILFNLKKGSNKILLKQISFRKFSIKYFKKNLKTSKQIIGILYYSFILKDSSMFMNFFKKILENINIKLHKKLIIGLKKLIKDLFKPVFNFLGIIGIFFNLKGKVGVSGSAKKRRFFFYYGKHSITSRDFKMDLKFLPI